MSSNNDQAVLLSGDFGLARHYDPAIFRLARVKGTSLEKAKLYITAAQDEILLAYNLFRDPSDAEEFFAEAQLSLNG